MLVTAGLPLRHPAVIASVVIFVLGCNVLVYEEVLRSAGVFPGGASRLKLLVSIIGLLVWTWLMLGMIGRPDLYFEASASLADADAFRRRAQLLKRLGYPLQAVTLVGLLAFLWAWS